MKQDETSKKAVSRRNFLLGATGAAGTAILAACGGSATSTPALAATAVSGAATTAATKTPPATTSGAATSAAAKAPTATTTAGAATAAPTATTSTSGSAAAPTATTSIAGPTAIPDPAKGTLAASPNPVPAGSGNGTTTIRWTAPPDTSVQIWVSVGSAPETLFAEGNKGSQDAPWIEAGQTYRFSMYAGKTHTAPPLQTVMVR